VDIRERLSRQEPDRADFLRDLSVSYERMGDLLRGLGQGEQARAYFQKDLEPQGMQHCYILSPGWRGLHLVVADFKGIRAGYHFRQGRMDSAESENMSPTSPPPVNWRYSTPVLGDSPAFQIARK
jgi:hypothetical protein